MKLNEGCLFYDNTVIFYATAYSIYECNARFRFMRAPARHGHVLGHVLGHVVGHMVPVYFAPCFALSLPAATKVLYECRTLRFPVLVRDG